MAKRNRYKVRPVKQEEIGQEAKIRAYRDNLMHLSHGALVDRCMAGEQQINMLHSVFMENEKLMGNAVDVLTKWQKTTRHMFLVAHGLISGDWNTLPPDWAEVCAEYDALIAPVVPEADAPRILGVSGETPTCSPGEQVPLEELCVSTPTAE